MNRVILPAIVPHHKVTLSTYVFIRARLYCVIYKLKSVCGCYCCCMNRSEGNSVLGVTEMKMKWILRSVFRRVKEYTIELAVQYMPGTLVEM